MSESPDRDLAQRAVAGNAESRELNGRLLEYLRRPRPAADDAAAHDWASGLVQQLTRLHERVSLERRGAGQSRLIERFSERYPRAAGDLQRLDTEHRRILDELRAIVDASMTYAEARTPPDPRLRERTRGLLEMLDRRDAEETRLLQDLVSTDVGAGD